MLRSVVLGQRIVCYAAHSYVYISTKHTSHVTHHTHTYTHHTHTYTQELNDFRATRQHRAACDQALSTVSTAVASRSTLELLSTISSQVCSAVLCVVQCCV
jgi:hypothetical protein